MRVSFLFSLLREDIIRGLFWTLVHSLWQGLALAILTGLVILFTRRSTPVLRYKLLLGVFGLFLIGVGATLFLELKSPALPSGTASGSPVTYFSNDPSEMPAVNILYLSGQRSSSWVMRWINYFDQKANLIVTLWFIILSIQLIKLVVNLGKIQRLRYYRTSVPDEYWRQRVTELARRIGIKKTVGLLESSLIRVPMMAGMLKPVILAPLGLLAQLPPQLVEAILLHELAHIRRKDYLVNLLQSFAETLFFFNPAVLWISSLIREERENCCDDMAIGETGSKKEFIHALVSFSEYRQADPSHALAFPGAKNHLLQRVKRIVHKDNKTLDIREKFFLLACLFITAGLTLAYTRQTPVDTVSAVRMKKQVEGVRPVEFVKSVRAVKPVSPGTEEKLINIVPDVNPVIAPALPDTSKKPVRGKDTIISDEEDRKWRSINEQQREAMLLQQQRLDDARVQLEKERELALEQERLNEMIVRARLDSVPMVRQQDQALRLQELELKLQDLSTRQSLRLLQTEKVLQASQERLRSATRLQSEGLLESQQRLELARIRLDRSVRLSRVAIDSRKKIIEPILEMLRDKKLISQTDDVSFSLDEHELIVNDKKQPDEVFQSFKEAFIHDPKDYVKYGKHGNTETSNINQHRD